MYGSCARQTWAINAVAISISEVATALGQSALTADFRSSLGAETI